MRRVMLAVLLLALGPILCGCQSSGEVENQAYVLVLGIDRLEDGRLALAARVPKVGKDAKPADTGGDGGSPYLTFTASGADWPRALEALQWGTPRQTNLSHIEMLVVSEALAREADFMRLTRQIAETPHLYSTARLVVCAGSAGAFVEAGETVIGTRMSAELRAMLKHYAGQGYIPDSSLADAYYAGTGFYADAAAAWAWLDGDAASGESAGPPTMKQRFGGAALFREGVCAGRLSLEETRLMSLIRGGARAVSMDVDGGTVALMPEGKPVLRVETGPDRTVLGIDLDLSASGEDLDLARLREELAAALTRLIRRCQGLGCDPFGFADVAAGHFATVPEWLSCGWRDRYAGAETDLHIDLRRDG